MSDWHAIDDGLWYAERRPMQGWSLRSIAVRLDRSSLAVVSPTRGLDVRAHEELQDLGDVAFLIAPNHFHHLGLAEFHERYPAAIAVASEGALPRLRKKTSVELQPLTTLRERLPDNVRILEPPGTRTGELWLRLESALGPIWVLGDAFFNVPEKPRGFSGLFLRATRTSPGLCLGTTFIRLALRDRRAYRDWLLGQLDSDPPAVLVPCHGEPVGGPDLVVRLRELTVKRLGSP